VTFLFGPDHFRVCAKIGWSILFRDQWYGKATIARTKPLIEIGVEESKCCRIYYFVVLFFSVMIECHDEDYTPSWMAKDAVVGNVIQFHARRKND
jgi:hypothetical protein